MSTLSDLSARQTAILEQIKLLDSRFGRLQQSIAKATGVDTRAPKKPKKDATAAPTTAAAAKHPGAKPSPAPVAAELPSDDDPSRWWDQSTYTVDQQGVVPRLSALCDEAGFTKSRFYRVASDYYDWPLEQRRDVLGAPSVVHLCKSVVMSNTHFKEPETPSNPRHILVIVSYAERLHKERLANAVYERYKANTPDALSKRAFDANWRLADNDEAIALTGYQHNGMTPIGMRTTFLMVLSSTVLQLSGGSFFLGGGEIDVKWRVSVPQFVAHFQPIVADIAMKGTSTD